MRHLGDDIQRDSIFNEFGVVFDHDEAITLRNTFLGFGIPWLVLALIAIYPFIKEAKRLRHLSIWAALHQEDLLPGAVKFGVAILAAILSVLVAVAW